VYVDSYPQRGLVVRLTGPKGSVCGFLSPERAGGEADRSQGICMWIPITREGWW